MKNILFVSLLIFSVFDSMKAEAGDYTCRKNNSGNQECTYVDNNGQHGTVTEYKDYSGGSTWYDSNGDTLRCRQSYLGNLECSSSTNSSNSSGGGMPLNLLKIPQSLVDSEREKRNPNSRLDSLRATDAYKQAYNQELKKQQEQLEKFKDLYMENCYFLEKKTEPCTRLLQAITGN